MSRIERIAYGEDENQFGILGLPDADGPIPVVIAVHGGFWRAEYDHTYMEALCRSLNAAGVATWSLEYRRVGNAGGGWPGTFQDVAAGADFLRRIISDYPLDLSQAYVLGHSAGGHLALWLAGRKRVSGKSELHDPDPLPIAGVVAISPICDLKKAADQDLGEVPGIVKTFMGASPGLERDRFDDASPAALIPMGVKQRLYHGSEDPHIPIEMTQRYVEDAGDVGDPINMTVLMGAGHFDGVEVDTKEWAEIRADLLEMIGISTG